MSAWTKFYKPTGSPPVITKTRPGKQIGDVINEIHEKALLNVMGNDEGEGDTPVAINVERIDGNSVRLAGSIDGSSLSGSVLPDPATENYVLTVYGGEWVCGPIRAL